MEFEPILVAFSCQLCNGLMVIEPLFGHHLITLNLQCLHAIRWQPKIVANVESGLSNLVPYLTFNGDQRQQN